MIRKPTNAIQVCSANVRINKHETGEHTERGPTDHARRVAVQGRAGDLLDETGIGRVELRLDLLQDLLLFVGERHRSSSSRGSALEDMGLRGSIILAHGARPTTRATQTGRSVLLGRMRPFTRLTVPAPHLRLLIGTPGPRAGARRAPLRRRLNPRPGPPRRRRRARRGRPSPPSRSGRSTWRRPQERPGGPPTRASGPSPPGSHRWSVHATGPDSRRRSTVRRPRRTPRGADRTPA